MAGDMEISGLEYVEVAAGVGVVTCLALRPSTDDLLLCFIRASR